MSEADDLRQFIHEIMVRFERSMQAFERSMQALVTEIREDRRQFREEFAEQRRKTDDLIAESRAQRAALFKLMDRLDNGGAAPA